MAMNLAQLVIGYLKDRPEEKFSARQIAEWVFATYPDKCQEKRANSRGDYIKSDADLVQHLVVEISSQRPRMQTKHPELKTTEGRPRKYYYSERSDSAEVAAAESESTSTAADASALKNDEHALYLLLSQYLWEEFGVFSKRIDEKRSSNKRGPNGRGDQMHVLASSASLPPAGGFLWPLGTRSSPLQELPTTTDHL